MRTAMSYIAMAIHELWCEYGGWYTIPFLFLLGAVLEAEPLIHLIIRLVIGS